MPSSSVPRRRGRGFSVWFQLLLAAGFVAALVVASLLSDYPLEILYLVAGMSLLAMALYAKDKLAARNNGWRISEKTLHSVSLIGGWPGAILAQRLFNHKTSKQSFRALFWLTVAINYGLVAWTLTGSGRQFLQQGLFVLKQYLQPVVEHISV